MSRAGPPAELGHYAGSSMKVEINDVEISASVQAKINSKHGVTVDDVLFVCHRPHVSGVWHDHPTHGRRLLIIGLTEHGRRLKIILFPIDVARGRFRLGTAIVGST